MGRSSESGGLVEVNRLHWDERVPINVASSFYDVEGFKAGDDDLDQFQLDEVGDVTGLDLVHLQCHVGLDTLSWARRGARVAGLDFSGPAIEAAQRIAAAVGFADRAQFVAGVQHDQCGSERRSSVAAREDDGSRDVLVRPEDEFGLDREPGVT